MDGGASAVGVPSAAAWRTVIASSTRLEWRPSISSIAGQRAVVEVASRAGLSPYSTATTWPPTVIGKASAWRLV